MDAVSIRERGRAILEPILSPHGFMWVPGETGRGSGGVFAQGAFVCGDRRLEFSVRFSVGLVVYHMGRSSLEHADYMRAVLQGGRQYQYPGFSNDPLDGFRHLAADLVAHGTSFLTGDRDQFGKLVEWVRSNPRPRGVAGQ